MDRTAMIEAESQAREVALQNGFDGMDDALNDAFTAGKNFALSLLQWKRIETADDLPTIEGEYVVRTKPGFYAQTAVYDETENTYWTQVVAAYIPIPIPQYTEGEDA